MRVLIVDDETEHRDYLTEIISGWKYETGQAANGEEALNLFKDTSFDIVLSDLMMPKMDGFELLKQLRAQGNLPPTILMTAFGSLEEKRFTRFTNWTVDSGSSRKTDRPDRP